MNFEVPSDIQTIVATRVAQRQKCNEFSILCLKRKGQLISEFSFGVFKSLKKPTKFFLMISALASKKRSNQKSSTYKRVNKIFQLMV